MVSPSSRCRYYSLRTSWRDPVSDRKGAGERSGLAAGPGRVGTVAERPPLVARFGVGRWILVSANRVSSHTGSLTFGAQVDNSSVSPFLSFLSAIGLLDFRCSPDFPGPTALVSVVYFLTFFFSLNPSFCFTESGLNFSLSSTPALGTIRCSRW